MAWESSLGITQVLVQGSEVELGRGTERVATETETKFEFVPKEKSLRMPMFSRNKSIFCFARLDSALPLPMTMIEKVCICSE